MILCGGENLIDLIAEPDGPPLRFRAAPGGSSYNVARALARLGSPVGYLAPIARDPLGDLMARTLEADGAWGLGGRSDRPCSLAVVMLREGQPSYSFHRSGTADRDVTAEGLRALIPAAATAVSLGSMALCDGEDAEAWEALFHAGRARGLFTALDPNIREPFAALDPEGYRARLARMSAEADLIKLSDEDMRWIAPDTAPVDAAAALFARARPAMLVLTMGAAGALCLWPGGRMMRAAAPLRRGGGGDTVGAGDTFLAAVLDGLRRGGALSRPGAAGLSQAAMAEVIDRAARAAAITCSRPGCDPPWAAELDG